MKADNARRFLSNQFPDSNDEIEQRLETDAMFREMCKDYVDIHQTLHLLQALPDSPPDSHIEALQALLQELEADLIRHFKRGPPPQPTNSKP